MDCSFERRSLIGCIEWTFFLKYYFPLFGAGLTSLQTVMWWWRPSDEMTHATSTFYQRTWYFLRLYTQNISNLHWGLDRESFLPIQAVEVLRLWITTCSGPFFTFKSEKLLLHSVTLPGVISSCALIGRFVGHTAVTLWGFVTLSKFQAPNQMMLSHNNSYRHKSYLRSWSNFCQK